MVWSDPTVKKLSGEFVPVAEEVHFLYPESKWALDRIADDPGHLLFKKYGTQVPEGEWNEGGTKQGIYLMGPNGEYLEGAHAASGSGSALAKRMERALKRWEQLAREKDYANRVVPARATVAPPEIADAPLALRVFMRDLPRGDDDDSGRRRTDRDLRGRGWMAFTEWAWNQKWLTLDKPSALVPKSKEFVPVPEGTAKRIVQRAFVDNVRGQNPNWKDEHVRALELSMRITGTEKKHWFIEYRGEASFEGAGKGYSPKIYGTATWNHIDERFEALRWVAIGPRQGRARFNQRKGDESPAPMGVLIELHAGRDSNASQSDESNAR